jgi:hypothetical protein
MQILRSNELRGKMAMPLPRLSDAEIARVIQQVAEYVAQQRQKYRGSTAVPLDRYQRLAMRPFFPKTALDSTRVVVLARERVSNPPFYPELQRMGFEPGSPPVAQMAAITFVDTVVSHEPFTDRLLFHELVHVVQYAKLGLPEFAAEYVKGFLRGGSYEAIPLEMNAYELDARFNAAPARPFSVEAEVQRWTDEGRF